MWIDTHCHLDAHEFGAESLDVARRAGEAGVSMIVIPAVERGNFGTVRQLAANAPNASYALGIHPIYVPNATEDDLLALRAAVEGAMADPNFVAIGEIGLDFFIPMLCEPAMREKQEHFFREQLRIARDVGLPVLMHVRRSQDQVLKHVRQIRPAGGIAHAFNGSFQQAQVYIDLGFKLGFGGAMTFTRALQIRRLAATLPLASIVLETDAPDISPAWIHPGRNSPEQLPAIGAVLAELRGLTIEEVRAATCANALAALPRLPLL
ncbi:TatD family hydrolase [Massilia antarctica]|uniref:TatD family hydrolase n=1 Tax=Massilia antarctica TaxID=2765360 RepID=UPI0006BB5BBE|nr:TatD family hydrolase [Massilia sp. H27-R4]MCY0910323.1 TatD family hydrolase [Massilia sp. H27-R4]CUI09344.1 Putative deoxyribonuclease YjjV [Janthinobacterium sp. CG23_2]CUU33130.1 Putative deoxyribonuclease YjjV [Janthinobacterium sp. CG23_2]